MKPVNEFLANFSGSLRAVERFAAELRKRNVDVWLPPTKVTPDVESRHEYADSGDMMFQLRAEHKVRQNLVFSGRDDYKYPTVFIDEKYKVDSKRDIPLFAYFIQSQDGNCVACVYGHTMPRWQVTKKFDSKENCHRTYYEIPKEFVRFCKPDEIFPRPNP